AGQAWDATYRENAYHLPDDEYDANWDWSGVMQDLQLFYRLGRMLGETEAWPNWLPDDEFRRVRDESCAAGAGCWTNVRLDGAHAVRMGRAGVDLDRLSARRLAVARRPGAGAGADGGVRHCGG